MEQKILCEVCIDSVQSAINAQKSGASRVELCDNLFEGGTTPSFGMIKVVRKNIKIPLHVLIRPRGGDFLYSPLEFEVIKEDILNCKQNGVDGVVIGILNSQGEVDVVRMKELVELARPMKVTFHRAFDMCKDPFKSLEDIISLGIERILTSGLESSCLEGLDMLTELVKKANNRIIILPGGGITDKNLKKVLSCGAKEFHISGRSAQDSQMEFRNTRTFMGGVLRPPEFSISTADEKKIGSMINQANS